MNFIMDLVIEMCPKVIIQCDSKSVMISDYGFIPS